MSLSRTLEPEVMDAGDEAHVYQAMDHRPVNERFVDDLIAGGPVGPRVVDLGCGPGDIPIVLSRRCPEVSVLGVDLSVPMLELAKVEIDIAGVIDRVTLEQADAKSMDGFDDRIAETVMSNSLAHHLDEPRAMLEQAIRLLTPGGRLFLRDLVRPDSEADVERLVELHAGEESETAQQLLRQSFHAALTLEEIRSLCGGFGFAAGHVQMTSDRHWTVDWVKPG